MGYVFRIEDAQNYAQWLESGSGKTAVELEKDLLLRLWSPKCRQTVLEVGCGTGLFLDWLARLGHHVTGIDPSSAMLDIAQSRVDSRISLDRGYGEHLPYEDGSFDTVALITSLEFMDDPAGAIQEAIRVARRHVLLGVMNKYSLIACQRYMERLWDPRNPVFGRARFFSILELRNMVEAALAGYVPLHWRTGLTLPFFCMKYLGFLERSRLFQRQPFGHFIAMRIDLVYSLQTIRQPLFCEVPQGGAMRASLPSAGVIRKGRT